MPWRLTPLFWVLLTGCEGLPDDPFAGFDLEWAEPVRVQVKKGDTLALLAKAHGVTVDELRDWNGISGDLIEVGQVLVMWPSTEASTGKGPARKTRKKVAGSPPTPAAPSEGERGEAPEVEFSWTKSSGLLGLLGDEDPGDSPDLAALAGGLERSGGGKPGGAWPSATEALGKGGTAEKSGVSLERRMAPAPQSGIVDGPVTAPSLTMPAKKSCKAAVSQKTEVAEGGMVGGEGLSKAQVQGALKGVVGHALKCIPSGSAGDHTATIRLVVGCDGRVKSSEVLDAPGFPAKVSQCVAKTLSYASFPAHDLPDGEQVIYPVTFDL
jgi:hypothetical protein